MGEPYPCFKDWVEKSQTYQAFATKIMTTAFRRNNLMNSFAIHLFIDAWPAGWMKTIMDCRRNPKKAFFTYRDKLSPVLADIRSDRFSFFEGETVRLESYVCNDLEEQQVTVKYRTEILLENRAELRSGEGMKVALDRGGSGSDVSIIGDVEKSGVDVDAIGNVENPGSDVNIIGSGEKAGSDVNIIGSGEKELSVPACTSAFAGFVTFEIPRLETFCQENGRVEREAYTGHGECVECGAHTGHEKRGMDTVLLKVRMTVKRDGVVLHGMEEVFPVYPKEEPKELSLLTLRDLEREEIWQEITWVRRAVLAPLEVGTYSLKGYWVTVKPCGMDPVYFVFRKTGHELVEGFEEKAFGYWYDDTLDRLSPISSTTLHMERPDGEQGAGGEVREVLMSGNKAGDGSWQREAVCAELSVGDGSILLCQIDFSNFMKNPAVVLFWNRLADR